MGEEVGNLPLMAGIFSESCEQLEVCEGSLDGFVTVTRIVWNSDKYLKYVQLVYCSLVGLRPSSGSVRKCSSFEVSWSPVIWEPQPPCPRGGSSVSTAEAAVRGQSG